MSEPSSVRDLSVRALAADDMVAFARLCAELTAYHNRPEPMEHGDWVDALRVAGPQGEGHFQALVVPDGEVLAGCAIFSLTYSVAIMAECVYLRDLFVCADYRQKGIGKMLFQGLARECVANGWPRVDWTASRLDFDARTFYEMQAPESFKLDRLFHRIEGDEIHRLARLKP